MQEKKENLPSARLLGMEALTCRSGGVIGKAVGWILEAHFLANCLSLTSTLEGLQVRDSGRRWWPLPVVAGPHCTEGALHSSFIPVLGLDVHLQSVAARGPVPAFLTHKELFSTMLKSLVQL